MALPAIRTEWSEELLFDLMRLAYASDDLAQEDVDAAVREAIRNEGTAIPVGGFGQTIRLQPGTKKRLRIADRIH